MIRNWENMEEEERQMACDYTKHPICPYCGYEYDSDTHQTFEPGYNGRFECEECGKVFKWTSDVEITYSTEKMEQN